MRVEPKPLAEATAWLENYRRVYETRFDAMDALLAELQSKPQGQKDPSS